MNAVVIGSELRDKLLAAGDTVEVHDETGKVIGRFIRTGPPAAPSGYEVVGEWPSDEETDRRLREDPSYTPAQVMERLRRLHDAR